jgi:hypothetical protein
VGVRRPRAHGGGGGGMRWDCGRNVRGAEKEEGVREARG